nr:class I SAM-dependent methyltransferase [Pararhizobium haloflavum]
MDGVYRHQRHFYDATRKYFLLGRDPLIAALDVPEGGSVLEVGCGTGRNLTLAAKRYPHAHCFGLDISRRMLETAARSVARANLDDRVRLARGDATRFECRALFGMSKVDRIFLSYTLSMIPDWQAALCTSLANLAPGGSLHIVDFADQSGFPDLFGRTLRAWLARFHVTPRVDLIDVAGALAHAHKGHLVARSLYRDYALHIIVTLPPQPPADAARMQNDIGRDPLPA